ncbi:Cytochrome c-type biogenesis protein CcmE, heme chaperone [uncultured Gammaproteobacteria bacterium]|jgi:cytochrome c-type biogenesis protein CcmE|uniref:cytochrome c maturation protein CcmE n=1 Tax=thiotrophic endosymbiont of Bathymodiolus puteoserpentis (Logatchev) TaxID=343240 RepID=UPI0010B1F016|nr:cytochrome c maturation protein CcmE [thiotrophic endosymbiont of Bathymodiolus puteoserpentis (Logatchev)]CAC9491078.1 Cytochrome c-type biogenesis protein CcmE, heme chaperone [uncultured Gammaproteobacteria bacterium]CAC9572259.1 Cytochrome c-type biogenesis protein CcmE, heme chaperone [uncultured Gammaproteobacteria bacterium]CAC9573155.1 Cytochrome c-type biogenesis protein CcmE, heme chaperone [uncultured Gammaproteobacteria bacterium]CAC9573775.1 Cytochrome c-type biogenesis protein 
MTKRQNRMAFVALLIAGAMLAVTLLFRALGSSSNYFYDPTQVAQGKAPVDRSFRLGGLVVVGSFKREDLKSTFDVTDNKNKFSIEYTGILPDLFREGQGIITTGSLVNGKFIATEVLAKHDENYMPPEVADALKEAKE